LSGYCTPNAPAKGSSQRCSAWLSLLTHRTARPSTRSVPVTPGCCGKAPAPWNGSSRRLGPALGLHANDWPQHEVELPAGHGLLLLTDGLFEGYSGGGSERLGEDGLLALARSHAGLPGPAFVDALIDGAQELAQPRGGLTDDIAVLRVERTTR
jgi:Stage II sporulation protein E (SpoIIE)